MLFDFLVWLRFTYDLDASDGVLDRVEVDVEEGCNE